MKQTYRTQARLIVAVAAALILAACGGSTADTPVPEEPQSQGTVVTVVATEFAFELSEQSFAPGTYTFVLENQGAMPHDLAIEGPGVETASALIGPGETTELTVEIQAGTYELWCTVAGHRSQGMETTIDAV